MYNSLIFFSSLKFKLNKSIKILTFLNGWLKSWMNEISVFGFGLKECLKSYLRLLGFKKTHKRSKYI